jgi:hypothetical protein
MGEIFWMNPPVEDKLQGHPGLVFTMKESPWPPEAMVELLEDKEYGHTGGELPSCCTVNTIFVFPAWVIIVPMRTLLVGLAGTEKLSGPVPAWPPPLLMVIQGEDVEALHPHGLPVTTLKEPLPPPAAISTNPDERE